MPSYIPWLYNLSFTYSRTLLLKNFLPLGAAHIKFWKMAQTFTGLKLKGELGRFGKTEICDVLGVYPMPDEKVGIMQFVKDYGIV